MGSSQTSYVFHGLLSQDVAYCPTGFCELTDGSFARAKVLVPECLDHVSTTSASTSSTVISIWMPIGMLQQLPCKPFY